MSGLKPSFPKVFEKSVKIDTSLLTVWEFLTKPDLIKLWISDFETEIISSWKVGNSIIIRGDLHGIPFENKGTILIFDPPELFQYNYISSLSELADKTENYVEVEFKLIATSGKTTLALTLRNLHTYEIYKHTYFYWTTTLEIIKKLVESESSIIN
jgi:uncharacterized protein YndB with AHSA1/START domain